MSAFGGWWRSRWPLLGAALLLAAWSRREAPIADGDPSRSLAKALVAQHGLLTDPEQQPLWIDGTYGHSCWLGAARALLLARREPAGPRDVYLVGAVWSPEQQLIELCSVHNLTETDVADETELIGAGALAAWKLESQRRTYRVEYADLDGDPRRGPEHFSWLMRLQHRLASLQDSGQWSGVGRRSFRVEPALQDMKLTWSGQALQLTAPSLALEVPVRSPAHYAEGPILEQPRALAQPSPLLQWSVDRARRISWLGVERLQWLKAVVYGGLERFERLLPSARLADLPETDDVAVAAAPALATAAALAEASGWPPSPIQGAISPPLPEEGQWHSLLGDPFVTQRPGLPSPMVTTFFRPDAARDATRVVVALWDPRRVDLHIATGTEEPKSATGEVGTGLIPRDPAVMSRLLGAFNGGFQSAHGAWGTFVDGKLYVPPRPYAATVAHFRDGSIGFGTWPESPDIPADVDAFRQNLTPLVSQGRFNPYHRQWWGGVPIGWKDTTSTVRSALCVTREGFVGYFYGSRTDHEALGRALVMARCEYGLHLDMNSGHTGFEFYSIVPDSEPALPREMLATRWKAEGPVPELPGFRYRARRLFRNMQLMHFPRYVQRQTRDFFYLTERRVLPESAGASAAPLRWLTQTRAGDRFPHPIARTVYSPEPERPDVRVRLLELDLKWLRIQTAEAVRAPPGTVFSVSAPSLPGGVATPETLSVDESSAHRGPPSAAGHALAQAEPGASGAAWGIIDRQILAYAELEGAARAPRDQPLLERVLKNAGARAIVHTRRPVFSALDGATSLDGTPLDHAALAASGQPALHFVWNEWRARKPLFEATPVVAPAVWQPHQP